VERACLSGFRRFRGVGDRLEVDDLLRVEEVAIRREGVSAATGHVALAKVLGNDPKVIGGELGFACRPFVLRGGGLECLTCLGCLK
jgi:hypothetical protein